MRHSSAALLLLLLFVLGFMLLATIAAMWRVFEKADKPGWAAIIPIYNYVVLLEIIGKPLYWLVFIFFPIVNWIIIIAMMIELANCFGKRTGFGIGMVFLPFIFIPILAFSEAEYLGPSESDE